MEGGFDSCRFDFRIDSKNGLTPSRRKKIERRSGYNTLFKCKTCGSLFDSRPALLTHKLTHNPVNEWTCPICECQSAGKMTLEQHLRKTHCIGSAPNKKGSKGGSKAGAGGTDDAHAALPPALESVGATLEGAAEGQLPACVEEMLSGPPTPQDGGVTPNSVTPPLEEERGGQEPPVTEDISATTPAAPSVSQSMNQAAPTQQAPPPGVVCVNVPIYIGAPGGRPPFLPPGVTQPHSVFQVMHGVPGNAYVTATPELTRVMPQHQMLATPTVVQMKPFQHKETPVESQGPPDGYNTANLTVIKQEPLDFHNTEIKEEKEDKEENVIGNSHQHQQEINLPTADGIGNDKIEENMRSPSDTLRANTQEIEAKSVATDEPACASSMNSQTQAQVNTKEDAKPNNKVCKRPFDGAFFERSESSTPSPQPKKAKLGLAVEKLWQNRKVTGDANLSESEINSRCSSMSEFDAQTTDGRAINAQHFAQSSTHAAETKHLTQPATVVTPNVGYATMVTEEATGAYSSQAVVSHSDANYVPQVTHSKGRRKRAKDPYCTAMFHTCRICKQLFDSSEKMWAHTLTHEEMYRKNKILQCDCCEFITDSKKALQQHHLDNHAELTSVDYDQDAPLNLTVDRATKANEREANILQHTADVTARVKRDLLSGSRLFTKEENSYFPEEGFSPAPSHPDDAYSPAPLPPEEALPDDTMYWECDFCDYISTVSNQVVKQHMSDVHGYNVDFLMSQRAAMTGETTGMGGVEPPAQYPLQASPSASSMSRYVSILPKVDSEVPANAVVDARTQVPHVYARREVEKAVDMQEEAGFFHYSKKQWRHLTQNLTPSDLSRVAPRPATDTPVDGATPPSARDGPMETTFHMCKICKKLFNSIWDKWEHNYLVHRESHCKLPCPWCSFVSFSRKKLQKHVELAHPEAEAAPADGKVHVCEVCGGTYGSTAQYRLHLLRHGEDGPPVFQCPHHACAMRYHTKSGLRNHMRRVHLEAGGEELRLCPYEGCGKQFSPTGMKRHLACHTEERPLLCTHPGCGQSFREIKHLRVHWLQHTDEKPMKCDYCEYSCRQRSSMNWHMKSRHGLSKVTGPDGKTSYA